MRSAEDRKLGQSLHALAKLQTSFSTLMKSVRRYQITTRNSAGNDAARQPTAVRGLTNANSFVSCKTTYLNVSGVYDTTTDPIIAQDCSVFIIDDGMAPPERDAADLTCADPNDPTACSAVRDKYPRYKLPEERQCQAAGGMFITVNVGNQTNGQPRTDVGTKCAGVGAPGDFIGTFGYYNQPGGCQNLVIHVDVLANQIDVIDSKGGTPLLISSTAASGVRVNSDCSTSFVQ